MHIVNSKSICAAVAFMSLIAAGCTGERMPGGGLPSSLKDVPSVRLNYRYEADVPAPDPPKQPIEERNAAVQNDFDQNRPQELLDRTITSPDSNRILAIYHRPTDVPDEFRLDMYEGEGKLLRKITSDLMAVHFPDTIRWSPDSSSVAFVAMLRGVSSEPEAAVPPVNGEPAATPPDVSANTDSTNANAGDAQPETDANMNASPTAPTPTAPSGILTFRTEQLYICNADGDATRPVTQSEGFIYFYYVWAPDSSMLAALALHSREWYELKRRADVSGAVFVPMGRPRIVEKSGRERRLDDGLTTVQPVWSPDSSKVATAFDKQIRIYDALGTNPTQAGIPLQNNLLISSQAYDRDQAAKLNAESTDSPSTNSNPAPDTLPDPNTLVSYNPIFSLSWNAPELLYFQTAFVKRMKNEADSATSFVRWHRLVLTPQANAGS